MLDGNPFGRARGIVGDGESKAEDIDELRFRFGSPRAAPGSG